MARPQNPVVFVPGITGSQLRDEYPVKPDIVFSAIFNKEFDRLCLHPGDLRYELREPARIVRDAVFPAIYGDLIDELRYNLADRPDRPVPVFPFAYDWRLPLAAVELQLAEFIEEVIARTALLRHYASADYAEDPKVDLVTHSMGGLIATGYLQATGAKSRVGRIATMCAPFAGSFEAPVKVLTGTSSLTANEPNSREREASRITPALYHLTPSFDRAVVDPDGNAVSLYDVDAWQPGVLQTIAQFIQLYGVEGPGNARSRLEDARSLLKSILDQARAHRTRLDTFKLADAGLEASRWMAIVGINSVTRIRLLMKRTAQGEVRYDLTGDDRRDEWTRETQSPLTGDGTVPFVGAVPKFLEASRLVCVRPDDLGYWEIGDKALLSAAGFHATVPQVNLVQRLIVTFLKGEGGNDGVWARPAPGVSEADWHRDVPIKGLKLKW